MAAMAMQQPDRAALVAEDHEIFPQNPECDWQVAQLLGERNRVPEPPEILASYGAWPDARQIVVRSRFLLAPVTGKVQSCFWITHSASPSSRSFPQVGTSA